MSGPVQVQPLLADFSQALEHIEHGWHHLRTYRQQASTSTDATAAPSSSYLTLSTWETLKAETEYTISQVMATQEASRQKAMWLPPPWAMVAMCILGFNEFCAALAFLWDFAFNPIMWFVAAAAILLGRALLKQIDLRAEFRHGLADGPFGKRRHVLVSCALHEKEGLVIKLLHLNDPFKRRPCKPRWSNVALYLTIWFISAAVVVLGHVLFRQMDLLCEYVLGLLKGLVLYVRYVLNMLYKLLRKLLHLIDPIQEAPLQTSVVVI
eukprot:SM000081S22619  [mRNA]  locus=s81:156086:160962:+ [translate_table: standard]